LGSKLKIKVSTIGAIIIMIKIFTVVENSDKPFSFDE
jgi:hypothetical protein